MRFVAQQVQRRFVTIVLILILIVSLAVSASFPLTLGQAEGSKIPISTIDMSVDRHSGKFFGGALQVIVTDTSVDDFDIVEDVDVTIYVQNSVGNLLDSQTFSIHETNRNSSKFEFYLTHVDSGITVNDIIPKNSAGICTIDLAECSIGADSTAAATLIYFGTGGDFAPTVGRYDDENRHFFIQYADEEVDAIYDDTAATLITDRDTYGQDNVIHLFIDDQDANLNPTVREHYTISSTDIQTLIELYGGEWEGSVDFLESGRNTARFEALIHLVDFDSGQENELLWTDDVMQLVLHDMVNYADSGFDNEENDVVNVSELSLGIDNVDGEIDALGAITFGNELKTTVTDIDQNKDSEIKDTIANALTVETEDGSESVSVDLIETGDNTGVFVPETSNEEIKITFVNSQEDVIAGNDMLELDPSTIGQDIEIVYHDPVNDDSIREDLIDVSEMMFDTIPTVELPDAPNKDGNFQLVIKDYNLNDNPRVKDVYTVTLQGLGPYPLGRGTQTLDSYALADVKINDNDVNFGIPIALTLAETGINTGRFSTTLNNNDILTSIGLSTDDPNQKNTMTLEYQDLFDSTPHDGSASILLTGATHTASPTIQKLIKLIDRMNIADSTATILKTPLERALVLLHDDKPGNDDAVCKKLDRFEIKVTNMLDQGNLATWQATKLDSKATALKDTFGC